MGLVVLAVVVGLLAGLAAGGRFRALGNLPFAAAPLLLVALAVQVLGLPLARVLPAGPTWAACLLLSAVLVGTFLTINATIAGTVLIAVGLLLNALAIVANGAMPVSAYAAARSGAGAQTVADRRHEPQTSTTRLAVLGDVIPVPLPLRPEVDSVGDLLVAAGLAQLMFCAVRPRHRRWPAPRGAGTRLGENAR